MREGYQLVRPGKPDPPAKKPTIAFLATSDFAAGAYWGCYKGKSYAAGSGTATSPGTLAAAEDVIFFNGAEWGLATQNNLLIAPNTTSFAVGPISGTVVGTVVISSVTYKIVVAWVGYVGCSGSDPASNGSV